jgi:hypothetical protein
MGETGVDWETAAFHRSFLGQIAYPANAGDGSPFHAALRREVLTRLRARLADPSLRRYPEHARVFDQARNLWDALEAARGLLIKSGIETRFRPDPSARERLVGPASRGRPLTPNGGPVTPDETWRFGYVGNVPVAVHPGPQGIVESYLFRFD